MRLILFILFFSAVDSRGLISKIKKLTRPCKLIGKKDADPVNRMNHALGLVPVRTNEVVHIAHNAEAVGATPFNEKIEQEFRAKYAQLRQLDQEIGNEINNLDSLGSEIGTLLQQIQAQKGEQEANVHHLSNRINEIGGQIGANDQHLADLNQRIANTDNEIAEKEKEIKRSKKKCRRRWGKIFGKVCDLLRKTRKRVNALRDIKNSMVKSRDDMNNNRNNLVNEQNNLRTQLDQANGNLAATNDRINQITSSIHHGNDGKQNLVEMRLYIGRLQPHMEVILKNLDVVDKLQERTPEVYAKILHDSLGALNQFCESEKNEIAKFQQRAG